MADGSGRGSAPVAVLTAAGGASPSLFVQGLPLPRGFLRPDDALVLRRDGTCGPDGVQPLWWEPRALWSDGSVRWLFLHARIEEEGPHRLMADASGVRARAASAGSGRPPRLEANPSGFCVRFGDGRTLDVDAGDSVRPEILEASPLSELVRLRMAERDGFAVEWIVRTDAVRSGLDVAWRITRTGGGAAVPPPTTLRFRFPGARSPSGDGSAVIDVADLVARNGSARFVIRDGARRGPCRLSSTSEGFEAVLFDAADAPPVVQGSSLRQIFRFDGSADVDGPPFVCALPAGYVATTGAIGPVALLSSDEDASTAPGIHRGLRTLLTHALALPESGDEAYHGVENVGDWPLAIGQYGAKGRRAYADNEYDMPYACFLGHAATADARFLALAISGAEHMADVDVHAVDGRMRHHGYGEDAEDHRLRRGGDSDLGHVWTDGLWLAWLWSGDPSLREAAERVTRWVVGSFRHRRVSDTFAVCERNLGWPLLVCVSALEHGAAPIAAEASDLAGRILRFLDVFTADPDAAYEGSGMPVWWRTAMQDGCKPFMLGVLGEGLERLHRLDGDTCSIDVLERIARFLADRTFDPFRMDFEYEVNAFGPGHRNIPAQQLIPLFIRGLLHVGLERGDDAMLRLAAGAFHAAAWCLHDPQAQGKEIALLLRGAIPTLALLDEVHARDAAARIALCTPSTGMSGTFDASAPCDAVQEDDGLDTGRGWIRVEYRADTEDEPSHLNLQAFFHASDVPYDHSSVTLLAFYDRLQVRFHDADRRLIGSLDAFVPRSFFRRSSGTHLLAVRYAAPGEAVFAVDGRIVARSVLDRPLSGAFRRFRVGARPGHWSVNGSVRVGASFGTLEGMPAELADISTEAPSVDGGSAP